MMEGDGGDGGFGADGGDDGGGGTLMGGAALMGGGLIVGGFGNGSVVSAGLSNLVPATPANLRKKLTELKLMLDEDLISAAEYDVLKARALGL